ncbi:gelsolin-like protein 2 isoform X1 [Mytilus galloprovincialis]|uniref:gelsolin-like protein 2 isoform X1 n=1 Tax=Mytilus galloprovincialis TaxID=29158 RepID=UPI003F7B3885
MTAGLRKAKKYDWKDSNMALFGSDTEKNVKKESALTEPAWKNAGKEVGLQIWRIVKFKVTNWAKDEYGSFYNGDSYIILNTYKNKDSDKLLYDVHFWIGKYSTQDEYGTAAYKTVELDTLLDGVPIQHREVQSNESSMFKGYFPSITLMEGGAETGFRSAQKQAEIKRLLHFRGDKKGVVVKEILRKKSKLDSSDVYILDLGLQIYQWNGENCNKDEKFKAMQYLQDLKSKRSGKASVETLDEVDTPDTHKFYSYLDQDDEEDDDDETYEAQKFRKTLHRLSNESGELQFSLVSDGTVTRNDFKSQDVFIFDTQGEVFVWIGRRTSEDERKNGMAYAHKYLMGTDHPTIPITVLNEGQESTVFNSALGN